MSSVFEFAVAPWKLVAGNFQADLARRIEHDLAGQTALSALDLRPTCVRSLRGSPFSPDAAAALTNRRVGDAGNAAEAHTHTSALTILTCKAPAPGGTGAADCQAKTAAREKAPLATTPGDPLPSACGPECSSSQTLPPKRHEHHQHGADRTQGARRDDLRVEPHAAGPSPDGVLSPVSPYSSRRSSLSTSALSSSGSTPPPPTPTPSTPQGAISVAAAAAAASLASREDSLGGLVDPAGAVGPSASSRTSSSYGSHGGGDDGGDGGSSASMAAAAVLLQRPPAGLSPSASTSTSTLTLTITTTTTACPTAHPSFKTGAVARGLTSPHSRVPSSDPSHVTSGAGNAAATAIQDPIATLAAAAPCDTAAASRSVAPALPSPLAAPRRLPRRPTTLRLRCIVRDPVTGSLLATAWGHVDDPDLPLRRPQGGPTTAVAAAAGSHGGGGGGGGGAASEAPGSLLLIEEQVLGRGAFGFVTLVSDAVTDRTYALKRMRRTRVSVKHVMQEQQALRLLMSDEPPPADGTCRRCGGVVAGAAASTSSSGGGRGGAQAVGDSSGSGRCPPPALGQTAQSSGSRCGVPAVGASGRPSGHVGGASGGAAGSAPLPQPPQQRACRCRVCMAAAATGRPAQGCLSAGVPGPYTQSRQAGAGSGASGMPAAGPARAAWLAKQQARGWLGLPTTTSQKQQRPATCQCRRRGRAGSFCVRQLGTFQDEQYLYLLMEHCPGGDLDRLVRLVARKTLVPRRSWLAQVVAGPAVAWRGLPEAAARFYAAGILLALQELHARCIVYRDLKPGNVLIDSAGYPRLADFGMAKVLDGPAGRASSACGTLDYMAPEVVKLECEQLAREGRVPPGAGTRAKGLEKWVGAKGAQAAAAHARQQQRRRQGGGGGGAGSPEGGGDAGQPGRGEDGAQGSYGLGVDWWSFGAVLHVLLTGSKPFCPPEAEEAGEDPARVLVRIINPWYEVPLPVYLSPNARDLLRRLLVRQPKWRLGCGPRGAEDVREHPFFAGFDWEAFEERRLSPPYPVTEVSLPEEQEMASVACFFGIPSSSAAESQPKTGQQQQQPQQQAQQEVKRLRPPQHRQQPPPDILLQDF